MSTPRPALRAPFPWFGGKSRAAPIIWEAFGADIANYIEPFAGSLAVLLARPGAARIETVNDIDCYLSNFWRALQAAPGEVARWADWPVNEADLHARHRWLVDQVAFREHMKVDPEYFDAKIAGWWVWGICQWIGGGWCQTPEWRGRTHAGAAPRGMLTALVRKPPMLGGGSKGVNAQRAVGGGVDMEAEAGTVGEHGRACGWVSDPHGEEAAEPGQGWPRGELRRRL